MENARVEISFATIIARVLVAVIVSVLAGDAAQARGAGHRSIAVRADCRGVICGARSTIVRIVAEICLTAIHRFAVAVRPVSEAPAVGCLGVEATHAVLTPAHRVIGITQSVTHTAVVEIRVDVCLAAVGSALIAVSKTWTAANYAYVVFARRSPGNIHVRLQAIVVHDAPHPGVARIAVASTVDVGLSAVEDAVGASCRGAQAAVTVQALAIPVLLAAFVGATRRTPVTPAVLVGLARIFLPIGATRGLANAHRTAVVDAVDVGFAVASEGAGITILSTAVRIGFISVDSAVLAMVDRRNGVTVTAVHSPRTRVTISSAIAVPITIPR